MAERNAVDATEEATYCGPYTVYFTGGLIAQHELAANVLI